LKSIFAKTPPAMAKKSSMGRVILGMRDVTSIKANKTKVNGQHRKSFILKYDN